MKPWAPRIALLLLVVAAWESFPDIGWVDVFFTSSPSRIAATLAGWGESGQLLSHTLITLWEAILGFGLGVVSGAAVGLLCALIPWVSRALFPLIAVGNSLPKLAFAPLLIGWFGFGPSSKVALAAAVVFFFIFFSVYSGLRTIDRNILANARILGASGWGLLRHIYLPSAFTWIISGVRLGLAYSFAAAVVGEYLGGDKGLGFLIVFGKEMLNLTQVFAGLVVVAVIVGLLDATLRSVERHGSRWRVGQLEHNLRT